MMRPAFLDETCHFMRLVALACIVATDSSRDLNAVNVSLTASDASGSTSFNAAGKWSNAQAPSAANDYFTAGFLMRTPTTTGGSNTFGGNSLSLDYSSANQLVGLAMKYGTGGGSVLVNNLKLNGGGIFNGVGLTMSVYGNITVLTNSFLDPQANGRVLAVYAPISGGSTNYRWHPCCELAPSGASCSCWAITAGMPATGIFGALGTASQRPYCRWAMGAPTAAWASGSIIR